MLEVKRLRQAREWNQTELAFHAGLAPSVISEIENGKRDPSARTLRKLAEALKVDVADLFPKGQAPLPDFNDQERRESPGIEVGEAFFVPLEEGEEPDTVTLEIHYVRLFDGDEPILKAVRKASPEEAAKMRQELAKSGRSRE